MNVTFVTRWCHLRFLRKDRVIGIELILFRSVPTCAGVKRRMVPLSSSLPSSLSMNLTIGNDRSAWFMITDAFVVAMICRGICWLKSRFDPAAISTPHVCTHPSIFLPTNCPAMYWRLPISPLLIVCWIGFGWLFPRTPRSDLCMHSVCECS